jgi:hypothetical protein
MKFLVQVSDRRILKLWTTGRLANRDAVAIAD